MSFTIMTDSTANLPQKMIEREQIAVLSLTFHVDGCEYEGNPETSGVASETIYQWLEEKKTIGTSMVNMDTAYGSACRILERGEDLLYIGLASHLSGTYQAVSLALEELQEKFPERTICMVDSQAASFGEGLLVKFAADLRRKGKSIEQVYRWCMKNRFHICHEFTVGDLFYLKRGGRISSTTAVIGTALHVKPVLYMNEEGQVLQVGKVRGRKKAIDLLISRMKERAIDPEKHTVCISHSGCLKDAEYLAAKIQETFGTKHVMISVLDPVIGVHAGPGALALFYYGNRQ